MMKHFLLLFLCLILAAPAASNDEIALDEIDKLVRLRNYPEAVSRLQTLAQKGSPEAQFRLAGLSGNDRLRFVEGFNAIDVSDLISRGSTFSKEWVTVIQGGPGDDILLGTNARHQIVDHELRG